MSRRTRTTWLLSMLLAAALWACSEAPSEGPRERSDGEAGGSGTHGEQTVTARADHFYALADSFFTVAEYDSAIAHFDRGRALYREAGNWELYLKGSNEIGYCLNNRGDYEAALDTLRAVLDEGIRRLGERHEVVATTYNHMGEVYNNKGAYEEALEAHQLALERRRDLLGETHPSVAKTYNNLGNVYANVGDYERAVEYFHKALAILGDDPEASLAAIYNNIGTVYGERGQHATALEYFQKTLAIDLEELEEGHPFLAYDYNNIGNEYRNLGDYKRSLKVYQQALDILLEKLPEHPLIANIYTNRGIVYADQGEYDRALASHQDAHRMLLEVVGYEKDPVIAVGYNNIGEAYFFKEDYSRALSSYYKSLALLKELLGDSHPHVGESFLNIAVAHRESGDLDEALSSLQEALVSLVPAFDEQDVYANPSSGDAPSAALLVLILQNKGEALEARHAATAHVQDLTAAVATYRLAAELADQARHGYLAESSKLLLAENTVGLYDHAIQAALRLYRRTGDEEHKEAAFRFAEKSKAGILLEAFTEAQARHVAGIPDTLLERERQLRVDLAGYEHNLANERSKPAAEVDAAKVERWQDRRFDLKRAYEALLRRFEAEYPTYYNLKYQTRTAAAEVIQQQLLDGGTTLVEYFMGQDSLYIFSLTPDAFDFTVVARDSLLEQQVERLRTGIVEQDYARYTTYARRLYQTLLAPVEEHLKSEHLIIVPDGVLSYVPFEALLTRDVGPVQGPKDYRTLPYLVEDYAVSYAYSATLLAETLRRERDEAERDLLAFAPIFADGLPRDSSHRAFVAAVTALDTAWTTRTGNGALPATREEVLAIQELFTARHGFFERLFGKRSRVYLERDATEARIKSPAAARYRYVHLATHGFASEAEPRLSRLLLARADPASGEDGFLHLGEVYSLRLNAELVVLSACQTGLGPIAQGEGLIGLTRGFLYAGAQNVLVSLWNVSDVTTRDLMVGFYEPLLGGTPTAEALRAAKRAMIHGDAKYARPFFWAPFILVGR